MKSEEMILMTALHGINSQRNAKGGINRFHFVIRETADEVGQRGFGYADQSIAIDSAVVLHRSALYIMDANQVRKIDRHNSIVHDIKHLRRKLFQVIIYGVNVLEFKRIFRLLVEPFGVAVDIRNFFRHAELPLSTAKSAFFYPFRLCRSKSKNNRPRWNFTGHINSQPMAGRYFYGLCNAHVENIA